MKTVSDALVHSLTASKNMLVRYVQDLTPQEYLHRPTPKANCVAWLLGHLTLSDRAAVKSGFPSPNPPALPALPEGFEKRFSRDEGCPQAGEFGDVTNLLPLFAIHRDLLIERVRSATPEELAAPREKPHPMFNTAGELANFLSVHSAMHAGQITIIRRSLGKPPLI
jgi:hypothetical protein